MAYGALVASQMESGEPARQLGRDTVVQLPLRVSSDVRDKYANASSNKLKALLSETEIFATLLSEYPNATARLPM